MDWLLSNYRWYRKLVGGKWTQIRALLLQDCHIGWVRGEAYEYEKVLAREDWRGTDTDAIYQERDKLLALAAKLAHSQGYSVELWQHPDDPSWDADWRNIVAITLPTGQMTWHIHDSELPLFDWLSPSENQWDGHTTEKKYERLVEFVGRKDEKV